MDVGKTTYGIVGIVVALLMVSLFAIPVIEEAGYEREYKENTPFSNVYECDAESATIAMTADGLTIDGVLYDGSSLGLAAFADTWKVILNGGVKTVQVAMFDSNETYTDLSMAEGDTFAFDGKTWTMTVAASSTTYTGTHHEPVLCYDKEGDYMVIPNTVPDEPVTYHYRSDSPVVMARTATGIVSYGETVNLASGEGTVSIYSGAVQDMPAPVTWTTYDTDDGSVGLQTGGTLTYNGSEFSISFYIPIEYYVLVPGDGTASTLFGVVGLLLVVAVLMMAVRLMGVRE